MSTDKHVTCVDKDGKKYEVAASDLTMRPSVYGVIIQDDKVLLVRQWDGYDFPGGGIDLGETIHEALVREVKEESGMDARVGDIVACENSFYRSTNEKFYHSILIYYLCEVTGGKLSIDGIDDSEKEYVHDLPEWVPLNNLDTIKFYNSVDSLKIIEKALAIR